MLLAALVSSLWLFATPSGLGVVVLSQPGDLDGLPAAIEAQLSDLEAAVEIRPSVPLPTPVADQWPRVRRQLEGDGARLVVWFSGTANNAILISVADVLTARVLTREVPADSASLETLGLIVRGSVLTLLEVPVPVVSALERERPFHLGAGWSAGWPFVKTPWVHGVQLEAGWAFAGWFGALAKVRIEAPLALPLESVTVHLQRFELTLAPTATWGVGDLFTAQLELGVALRLLRAEGQPRLEAIEVTPAHWGFGASAFVALRPQLRLWGPLWLYLEAAAHLALKHEQYQLETPDGFQVLVTPRAVEVRPGAGLIVRWPTRGR